MSEDWVTFMIIILMLIEGVHDIKRGKYQGFTSLSEAGSISLMQAVFMASSRIASSEKELFHRRWRACGPWMTHVKWALYRFCYGWQIEEERNV